MTRKIQYDENGRVCNFCKTYKAWSEFPLNGHGLNGHSSQCLICKQKRTKKGSRDAQLRTSYGISEYDYNRILKEQNDVCKICGGVSKDGKPLHVDHCHKTGRIRGLLCSLCNLGLGAFRDSSELLILASRYLLKEELKDASNQTTHP